MRAAFTLVELMTVVGIIGTLLTITLPSLWAAREIAKSALCLANLRGMNTALGLYTTSNDGHYPLAYHSERIGRVRYSYAWDFTNVKDWNTREEEVTPGLLWQGQGTSQIHQCPSFDGSSNWQDDPYTGYNYNTSFLGYNERPRDPGEPPETVTIYDVLDPSRTAVFGDGEYEGGANKFMRSPLRQPPWDTFVGRSAGTQGYRHLHKTNVAWADGRAGSWAQKHNQTHPDEAARVPDDAPYGYLSADNSLYDLK